MRLRAGQKTAVFGTFQSGKSTLVRFLAARCPAALVFDPCREFAVAPFLAVHPDRAEEAVRRGARHVAVQADPEDFDGFMELANRLRGWLVVVDELSLVVTSPSPGAVPPGLSRLWRLAHKEGTGILVATHRLSEVPVLLRMTHHTVFLRTPTAVDAEAARPVLGDHAAALPRVPAYHSIYVGVDGGPYLLPPVPVTRGRGRGRSDGGNASRIPSGDGSL